jgi:hypothetical protein
MADEPLKSPPGALPGTWAHVRVSEEQIDKFYSLFGRCINEWSHIDRAFFDCCEFALGVDEVRTSVVYYRWPTFGGRRDLTSELMAIVLAKADDDQADEKKQEREAWAKIKAEVERLTPLRNVLAHEPTRVEFSVVWDLHAEGGPKVHKTESNLQVYREPKKLLRGKVEQQVFALTDLEEHLKAVKKLREDIRNFLNPLKHAVALKKQFPGPSAEHLQGLRNQTPPDSKAE